MASLSEFPDTVSEHTCAQCGDQIERGYVTATSSDDGYVLHTETAVCDTCGWSDVGATGCAPTLGDFDTGDVLVRIERDGDHLVPASITDDGS